MATKQPSAWAPKFRLPATPEIVDPGRVYTVVASDRPRTTRDSGMFHVPVTSDAKALALRIHESGHLKWSPSKGPAQFSKDVVEQECIGALEDFRINRLLAQRVPGFHGALDVDAIETTRKLLANPVTLRHGELCGASVASVTPALLSELPAHIDTALRYIAKRKYTFASVRAAAKRLAAHYAREDTTTPLTDIQKNRLDTLEEIESEGAKLDDKWAPISIVEIPLPRSATTSKTARVSRASEAGSRIRVHHLAMGHPLFCRRNVPQLGGALLVDCSGSMSWGDGDAEKMLAAAPLASIALYAGCAEQGYLVVAARDGRIASYHAARAAMPCAYGNSVDGLALEWLISQPGPRVWVTDCEFTGATERRVTPDLYLRTIQRAHAGQVAIVNDVTTALELFDALKRGEVRAA